MNFNRNQMFDSMLLSMLANTNTTIVAWSFWELNNSSRVNTYKLKGNWKLHKDKSSWEECNFIPSPALLKVLNKYLNNDFHLNLNVSHKPFFYNQLSLFFSLVTVGTYMSAHNSEQSVCKWLLGYANSHFQLK